MTDVGTFFDRQADSYTHTGGPMAPFHRLTAQRIEAGVSGRVLSIGGLWAEAQVPDGLDLTVVDISPAMLETWRAAGHSTLEADARDLPLANDSVDHVVFALVLHHIVSGGFRAARNNLDAVFAEVHRVLKPGGQVWISDFEVPTLVYAAEAVMAPVTKRVLAVADIPLVVMHRRQTYVKRLERAGLRVTQAESPRPAGVSPFDRLTPVIGLPWLQVPRALYPLRPVLVHASKA